MLVNFTVTPTFLRVPYVAAVSLVWTAMLSGLRGRELEAEKAKEPGH